MRRIAFAVLSSFLFASLLTFASPAKAAATTAVTVATAVMVVITAAATTVITTTVTAITTAATTAIRTMAGYHHGYYPQVWYSSHCCFRKIVRHERSVFFERLYQPYYHHGYYGRLLRGLRAALPRGLRISPIRRRLRLLSGTLNSRRGGTAWIDRRRGRAAHGTSAVSVH